MKTKESPTVREDGLHSSDLPGVLAIPHERAKVQSSGWHDWLLTHSKFRVEISSRSFTAYKSEKGYWTAQRRKDGKLRHQYLGESHTLTYETLDETARILGAPDYWNKHVSDKGRPREADKELRQESHNKPYETKTNISLSQPEIEKLQAQVTELEVQLKERNQQLASAITQKERFEGKAKAAEALAIQQGKEISRLDAKLAEALLRQSAINSPDPAGLFNELRPLLNRLSDRERRAIQQKLEEILD
jgi:chromosome segregation ATPase